MSVMTTADLDTATPDRYGDFRSDRVDIFTISDMGNRWCELWIDDVQVDETFDTFEDAIAYAKTVTA